jgi:hypothetical protein
MRQPQISDQGYLEPVTRLVNCHFGQLIPTCHVCMYCHGYEEQLFCIHKLNHPSFYDSMYFCPTNQVESNSYDCETKTRVLFEYSTNMEPSVYCRKVNVVNIFACNRILGQQSFFFNLKLLRQPLIARN